ncbi:hypothetical protein LguiB_014742 [Lonicera macranthoides]
MKDYHLQTPQKEHLLTNRRTHSIALTAHAKKPQKNQAISPSFETVAQSNPTVLSSQISANEGAKIQLNRVALEQWNGAKKGTVEAEMVVKYLRLAQTQVLNSVKADLRSQKLLDALIKTVIEEFYGLAEEKDWFTEVVSRKALLVLSSFVLWIFAVVAVFFFSSGTGSSFNGPPPT